MPFLLEVVLIGGSMASAAPQKVVGGAEIAPGVVVAGPVPVRPGITMTPTDFSAKFSLEIGNERQLEPAPDSARGQAHAKLP